MLLTGWNGDETTQYIRWRKLRFSMTSKDNILLNSPISVLTESKELASMRVKLLGSNDPRRQEKGKTQDTLVSVELYCQNIHQIDPNDYG